MAWISDGKLAAAVSNGGGLGIISAMNANAEYLRKQIDLARQPDRQALWRKHHADVPLRRGGGPAGGPGEGGRVVDHRRRATRSRYMPMWLEAGIKVIPVVASSVGMAKLVDQERRAAASHRRGRGVRRPCRRSDHHGAGAPGVRRHPPARCWQPAASATAGASRRHFMLGAQRRAGAAPGSWWPRSAASIPTTRTRS